MSAGLRDLLMAVYEEHGHLTPELIVDVARNADHPLHPVVFDKNLEDAAEAYYRDRAHHLICSVKITFSKVDEPKKDLRAFHCVRSEEGFVYHPAETIAADPFFCKLVMADMEREWQQLKNRYDNFAEFWELVRRDSAA